MSTTPKPTAADLSKLVQQFRDVIVERRNQLAHLGLLTPSVSEDLDREEAEVEVMKEIADHLIARTATADEVAQFGEKLARIAASDQMRELVRPTVLN